ncbi:MAG: hypothetical protein PHI86_01530 [Candidatus Omnitrophica bacterium]|nr:hypothetical protein [Candidatus Omnitrophota bacterium]HOX54301.1 hypothetical protein [Candidatus Omnitrophota bacterium]
MKLYSKKGQSILEYTLILGVVIAAIIFVLVGAGGGGVRQGIEDAYDASATALQTTVGDLTSGVFTP